MLFDTIKTFRSLHFPGVSSVDGVMIIRLNDGEIVDSTPPMSPVGSFDGEEVSPSVGTKVGLFVGIWVGVGVGCFVEGASVALGGGVYSSKLVFTFPLTQSSGLRSLQTTSSIHSSYVSTRV